MTLLQEVGQTETSAIFAGTGLNIDIDVKKEKRRRKEENIFNQMEKEKGEEEEEQETSASSKRKPRVKRKSGESSKSKQKETVKGAVKEEPPSNDGEMEGSEEDKRKRLMMEKAKALSRKIAGLNPTTTATQTIAEVKIEDSQDLEDSPDLEVKIEGEVKSTGKEKKDKEKKRSKSSEEKKDKEKSREHKRKRHKGARFEGKRIKGLKKWEPFRKPKNDDDGDDEDDDGDKGDSTQSASHRNKSAAQDEYVLAKLFKKSGVHSALRHDAIVDSGAPDYAIVEAEAKKVAAEAAARLKVIQLASD